MDFLQGCKINSIDVLKVIGLLLIILAHVNPGFFLMQVRNFDVPLMVLISGYLADASYSRSKSQTQYYLKRFLRLYLPTALFLTVFFLFFYFTSPKFPFSFSEIFYSYLLTQSKNIGYVWIIRVFLLCSLMVPYLVKWKEYIFSRRGIIGLIVIYAIYEGLIFSKCFSPFLKETILYAMGYGFVLILGMGMSRLSQKNIYIISFIFGIIYIIISMYLYHRNGEYISTQNFKYPPRLYYLSYAISVGYLLFALTENIHLKKRMNAFVYFISCNSLNIYFWHIFYIHLLKFHHIKMPWYIKYVIILFSSFLSSFLANNYLMPRIKKMYFRWKIGNFIKH